MKMTKQLLSLFNLFLTLILVLSLAGCSQKTVQTGKPTDDSSIASTADSSVSPFPQTAQTVNLMKSIQKNTVTGKSADNTFIASTADFAVSLFQKTVTENENSLISPLSVMLALAMTANGADSQTKSEMETLLGGTIPLEELNEYLYSYVQSFPSDDTYKLHLANSIWFRDDENRLTVNPDFLQKNADYYGAGAYKRPFDQQTLQEVNDWVKENTNGMIHQMIDQIDAFDVMYLINAIAFDAEWDTAYTKNAVGEGTFTAIDGSEHTVEMMSSTEHLYLDDGKASGFMKDYKGGKYSFAALLPKEGIDINDYVASLTGEDLIHMIQNAKNVSVSAQLPKFSYDYFVEMDEALITLGMPTAFDDLQADFSKLGKSTYGNIYMGHVLHKTFISVDELGTKAGAATIVIEKDGAVLSEYSVVLDRPFVYLIIDRETSLPLFMGTVMDF